jgi:hypothetical protein
VVLFCFGCLAASFCIGFKCFCSVHVFIFVANYVCIDREFTKRFPGITICRLMNEVFISTRESGRVTFGVDAI